MSEDADVLRCPRCRSELHPGRGLALNHACPKCAGVVVTIGALRSVAAPDRLKRLWIASEQGATGDPCPSCGRALAVVPAFGDRTVALDVCRRCQLVWFDADELKAFAPIDRAARHDLSPAAREALALAQLEAQALGEKAERQARIAAAVLTALFGG